MYVCAFFKDCYQFSWSLLKRHQKMQKKKQQQIDKNKNPPSSEFLLVLGEREIGLQHKPTHTNFTLFVLLLVAVAWHVAANARLHKYEYISLSLSSWWYPQTAAAEDRVIILLPPSSCDGWGISKILKHCPVVDMYLPSSR